jgi:hypothetical protein
MFTNTLDKQIKLGKVACFGGGGTTRIITQEEPPSNKDKEVQAAKEKERELARMRRGRSSTILTSGAGLSDSSSKKTLLGQ